MTQLDNKIAASYINYMGDDLTDIILTVILKHLKIIQFV